jgi:hypothetical protein
LISARQDNDLSILKKGMDSAVLYAAEQNDASITLSGKLGFKIGHNWKFMRKNLPQIQSEYYVKDV